MAQFGIEVTDVSFYMNLFYTLQRRVQMNKHEKRPASRSKKQWNKDKQAAAKAFEFVKKQLCDLFIEAVINHDGRRIKQLAESAWFFEGKLGDDFKPVDPKRYILLDIKQIINSKHRGYAIPMSEIVFFLKENGIMDVGDPTDGHSKIRRLCKELGIRIASRETKLSETLLFKTGKWQQRALKVLS